MKSIYDCYTMNNGIKIPCVAYGTYKTADGKSTDTIAEAIACGYRYFDTASFYETETYLAEAIQVSGLNRSEFFITSKVWKEEMGYEETKKAFARTLENLKTDYLDLYLIHWPKPSPAYEDWKRLDLETWRAMEELYKEGKIKALGVSNFLPHHLENLLANCEIKPTVNQIEFHPGYTQEATVQYCQEHDIIVQAWSPIGRARMLNETVLIEMAERYHVSPAQICLRYAVQRGIIPLPKSSSKERMKQNQDLFSFSLEEEDMWRLTTLPQIGWSGEHPDRERIIQ